MSRCTRCTSSTCATEARPSNGRLGRSDDHAFTAGRATALVARPACLRREKNQGNKHGSLAIHRLPLRSGAGGALLREHRHVRPDACGSRGSAQCGHRRAAGRPARDSRRARTSVRPGRAASSAVPVLRQELAAAATWAPPSPTARTCARSSAKSSPPPWSWRLPPCCSPSCSACRSGIIAAVKQGKWPDHLARFISLIGTSMPVFWLGLLLAYLVTYRWQLLPRSGQLDVGMRKPPHVTGFISVDALLAGDMDVFWSLSPPHHPAGNCAGGVRHGDHLPHVALVTGRCAE